MGWKDDKWQEAPGYCVECDNLRPLNKAGVCKECWESHPISWYERWEEDEYNSQWYYKRLKEEDTTFNNENVRIDRKQAQLAAQALSNATRKYGREIFRVTRDTLGLHPQAVAQVRFLTANQDFRKPPENQFEKYLEDPTGFNAEEIAAFHTISRCLLPFIVLPTHIYPLLFMQ